MAEYEGMDEATLQQKLDAATSYDERSAIRQALRLLKKERGEQVGSARKGQSGYSRFVPTKPVGKSTAKNYVHLDTSSENSAASASSPVSPTSQTTAKKRDVVGMRGVSSPTPQTLGVESSDTAAGKDSTVTHASVVRSSPALDRDDESARVPPARIVSPPPPLSPVSIPRDDTMVSDKEEVQKESNQTENDAHEEVSVGKDAEDEEDVTEEKDEAEKENELKDHEKEETKTENLAVVKPESQTRPLEEPDIASIAVVAQKETPKVQSKEVPILQGVKLHKTSDAPKNSKDERKDTPKDTKFDFGVKLKRPKSPPPAKMTPSTTESTPSWREKKSLDEGQGRGDSSPRVRAHTVAARPQKDTSAPSGGPRTLRDFQELTNRARKAEGNKPVAPLENTQLYAYLNAYVTKELGLPSNGASLYDVCSSSSNLCKLINKSVPNTVDLRALTSVSSTSSKHARDEAEQENMTLVTESARAIGCHISDMTIDKILHKDPETLRNLLVDLIRARVVNMPGMDEEPASVFQDMKALFEKLEIKVDDQSSSAGDTVDAGISVPEEDKGSSSSSKGSWRDRHLREEEATPSQQSKTWREQRGSSGDGGDVAKRQDLDENLSYEERAARRRAARASAGSESGASERKEKLPDNDANSSSQKNDQNQKGSLTDKPADAVTYEERAAQRRAERERRMKEREALATAK